MELYRRSKRRNIGGIGGFNKPLPPINGIYFDRKMETKIENDSHVNNKKRIKKDTNLTKNKETKKKEETQTSSSDEQETETESETDTETESETEEDDSSTDLDVE